VLWCEPTLAVNQRPVLLSERASHINKPTTDSNSDRLAVVRNITSKLLQKEVQLQRDRLLEWRRKIQSKVLLEKLLVVWEISLELAQARGQFGNPDEGESPPVKFITRELVKTQ
jgi:hypothetical protein